MSDHRRTSAPAGPRGPGGPGGPGGLGRPVEKPKNARFATRRLGALLRPHRGPLGLIFALALGSTVFSVLGPKLLGDATTLIVDSLGRTGAVDFASLGRLLLLLLGLYALSSVFSWGQQWVMATVAQKVVTGLRTQVHGKLARLPLKFFDGHRHGDVLSRVTNDVDTVSGTLQQALTQVVTSAITLVGTLAMMLWISPVLTLVALVVMPLVILVIGAVTKRSRKHFAEQQKSLGDLSSHVEEMLTGHAEVQAFGREQTSVEAFDEVNGRLYSAAWKAQFLSGVMMPMMNFVNNLGYVAVCVAGGLLAAGRGLTVGDIQAFLMYLRQFGMPLAQTAGAANIFQSTLAAAERIFELLDETEESPEPAEPVRADTVEGRLVIENLGFRYVPDRPLLEGLNLAVEPGQVVAIVGATGAGKTTLVNLLLRFYDLDEGRILLDGTDIVCLGRSGLRRHFGMVLQDTWLFEGTIRENLVFGRPGTTDAEVRAAAEAAHADHFIRTLPLGYETVLGEEAAGLSQGQLQLLTIARALLADPAVLILDEATSSVDTRTERALQRAMKTLMKGRTSFVIAHRLSTIRDADVILVMDRGRVAEQGGHDELLAAGGAYAALYASQFTGAPDPAMPGE